MDSVFNVRESKYGDVKQLEAAIREAYVAKELRVQIMESEATRVAEEARERLRNDDIKRELKKADKTRAEESVRIKLSKISYGVELRNVIESKKIEKLNAVEIGKKEREVLEEVSRVIENKYETRKIIEKINLADKKLRELKIFREIRKINDLKEAEMIEEKRKEDLKYLREIERRIFRVNKLKDERRMARESVIEAISKSLLESESKKLEKSLIISDIVVEEKLLEEELKLSKERDRVKSEREESIKELERQMIFLEERRLRDAIADEEFSFEVMKKVLEDKRMERLTADARKRKKIEYRKSLELIIEERRKKREEELMKIEESLVVERRMNDDSEKRVRDMRKNLLLRHVEYIAEFISNEALDSDERDIVYNKLSKSHSDKIEK